MGLSKQPSAPFACATASSPIQTRLLSILTNIFRRPFSMLTQRRSTYARRPVGLRLTAKATRYGWARRTRAGLLFPISVALLGVRFRMRVAEDRRRDAKPRRQLFTRSEGS